MMMKTIKYYYPNKQLQRCCLLFQTVDTEMLVKRRG